jgi:hypothetical protein
VLQLYSLPNELHKETRPYKLNGYGYGLKNYRGKLKKLKIQYIFTEIQLNEQACEYRSTATAENTGL